MIIPIFRYNTDNTHPEPSWKAATVSLNTPSTLAKTITILYNDEICSLTTTPYPSRETGGNATCIAARKAALPASLLF